MEPVAAKLKESRREIVELALSIPAEAWAAPSPNEGWTYKDLLAHLAMPEAQLAVLRAVTGNMPADATAFRDLDARNERRRRNYEGHSVRELISEVEAAGEELPDLLSLLDEADEDRVLDDWPLKLGDRLRNMTNHDRQHLPHLRTAAPQE